jgi:hypothetical protein
MAVRRWGRTVSVSGMSPEKIRRRESEPSGTDYDLPNTAERERRRILLRGGRGTEVPPSIMGRPLLFRRVRPGLGLHALHPGRKGSQLRPQTLDLLVLAKDDVTQLGVRTLEKGYLGLDLLESLGVHGKACLRGDVL